MCDMATCVYKSNLFAVQIEYFKRRKMLTDKAMMNHETFIYLIFVHINYRLNIFGSVTTG